MEWYDLNVCFLFEVASPAGPSEEPGLHTVHVSHFCSLTDGLKKSDLNDYTTGSQLFLKINNQTCSKIQSLVTSNHKIQYFFAIFCSPRPKQLMVCFYSGTSVKSGMMPSYTEESLAKKG